MVTRIRHVASISPNVEQAAAHHAQVLGLQVSWKTEIGFAGLHKWVLPAGRGTFFQIMQPKTPENRFWKLLEGRSRGKFFSLIVEDTDVDALAARVERARAKISQRGESEGNRSVFMHPGAMNGVLIEVLQPLQPGTWPNGGPAETQQVGSGALVSQLRQVVVVVRDLDEAMQRWTALFDVPVANRYRVPHGDLNAAVLPFGDNGTALALVTPASSTSPAARYLERYGEGLYEVIFETPDLDAAEKRVRASGQAEITRVARDNPRLKSLWLHPRSTEGVFFQLAQVTGGRSWPPTTSGWQP